MLAVNSMVPSPGGALHNLGLLDLEDCLRSLIENGLVRLIADNRYFNESDVDAAQVLEVSLEVDGFKVTSGCVAPGKLSYVLIDWSYNNTKLLETI